MMHHCQWNAESGTASCSDWKEDELSGPCALWGMAATESHTAANSAPSISSGSKAPGRLPVGCSIFSPFGRVDQPPKADLPHASVPAFLALAAPAGPCAHAAKHTPACTHQLSLRPHVHGVPAPQVILVNDIENVGKKGEIKTVPVGYWRNYLLPNGIAKIASESILE